MGKSVTLFIMTQKGYEVLKAIAEDFRDNINAVISSRDLSIQKDYYEEIKEFCIRHGILFYDRADAYVINSQYAIAVSWRWLINKPPTQLIVLHDSLLPKYRGFNPLVSALINGEKKVGVTALLASERYDRGDIISQFAIELSYPIKIQDAIELMISSYKEMALRIIQKIANGETMQTVKQNEKEASYSLWRDEEDYKIDWSQSSEYIKRFIDAVGFPYKGAATTVSNKIARILDAEVVKDVKIENRTPGKVIFVEGFKPVVVCGTGLLKINEIVDDQTKKSLLPMSRFRIRFK